jgi:hypothetical protein
MIKESLGNTELLKLPKTAFLCSRVSATFNHRLPASVVLKCYDSAIEQREKGNCVISGFHSQIGLAVKLRCAPDSRKRLADSTIVHPFRL